MSKIKTNYIIHAKETYKGVVEVEQSIWDYATAEFTNKLQVGIPEDPVLERVIEIKKFPILIKNNEISYWTCFPTTCCQKLDHAQQSALSKPEMSAEIHQKCGQSLIMRFCNS